MAPHYVVIVDDEENIRATVEKWIKEDEELNTRDIRVIGCENVKEGIEQLEVLEKLDCSHCVVLDMFFPRRGDPNGTVEAQGQQVIDRNAARAGPIVLISAVVTTKQFVQRKPLMPMVELEKPMSFIGTDQTARKKLEVFQSQIVNSVKAALIVSDQQIEIRNLERQIMGKGEHKLVSYHAVKMVVILIVLLVLAGLSESLPPKVHSVLDHLTLTLMAVIVMHLVDRVVLYKDLEGMFLKLYPQFDRIQHELGAIQKKSNG